MMNAVDFSRAETLRNGLDVTIRSLRADDRERIAKAIGQLDRESIYTRLFSYRSGLTEAGLNRVMAVDQDNEVALVVTIGSGADETVIASGRYIATPDQQAPRSAEVAFVVEDDYHGLGIASRIFAHLADIARARGIAAFEADVLAENPAMLKVFAKTGLKMRQRREGGVVHLTLALNETRA